MCFSPANRCGKFIDGVRGNFVQLFIAIFDLEYLTKREDMRVFIYFFFLNLFKIDMTFKIITVSKFYSGLSRNSNFKRHIIFWRIQGRHEFSM